MKNYSGLLFSALVAVLALAAGINFAAADQTTQSPSPAASPSPAGSPFVVSIKNFAFSPNVLTIPVGATVTWKNQDSPAHTVTAKGKDGFDSGNVDNGKTFSMTFNKAGTFNYICSIHPSMTGTIVVGKPQPDWTPPPPPTPASGY